MPARTPEDTRTKVFAELLLGISHEKIAEKYGISRGNVGDIQKEFSTLLGGDGTLDNIKGFVRQYKMSKLDSAYALEGYEIAVALAEIGLDGDRVKSHAIGLKSLVDDGKIEPETLGQALILTCKIYANDPSTEIDRLPNIIEEYRADIETSKLEAKAWKTKNERAKKEFEETSKKVDAISLVLKEYADFKLEMDRHNLSEQDLPTIRKMLEDYKKNNCEVKTTLHRFAKIDSLDQEIMQLQHDRSSLESQKETLQEEVTNNQEMRDFFEHVKLRGLSPKHLQIVIDKIALKRDYTDTSITIEEVTRRFIEEDIDKYYEQKTGFQLRIMDQEDRLSKLQKECAAVEQKRIEEEKRFSSMRSEVTRLENRAKDLQVRIETLSLEEKNRIENTSKGIINLNNMTNEVKENIRDLHKKMSRHHEYAPLLSIASGEEATFQQVAQSLISALTLIEQKFPQDSHKHKIEILKHMLKKELKD